jgi:Replication initiator protein A.
MRKLFVRLLKRLTKSLDEEQEIICQLEEVKEAQETPSEELQVEAQIIPPIDIEEAEKKTARKSKKKSSTAITTSSFDPRDIMESMGVPYLALSKNRKSPIIYESPDGTTKIRISCHSEQYIASIYDWDIIQCIAGKIQEVINSKSDIPSRTIIVPRHKLLKELNKHDRKKKQKRNRGKSC